MQGSLVAGRYLLAEEIGSGAMGVVFKATDLRTGGVVALKLLHPLLQRDATYRQRLRREAQIAASLTSPRIVRVTDLDEHDGGLFLVMEYVGGDTLQDVLTRQGRIPVADALAIGLEVARALEAAHARGVVHRDLKPQNIMLIEGHVKVLDFGIARADDAPGLSHASGMLGTPEYCAPEQAMGRADIRSDIYALGVTLYALIEGRVPFTGPTPLAVLRQHETAEAVIADWVPAPARTVISRCLVKDASVRFQTPSDLANAIEAALADLPHASHLLLQPIHVEGGLAASPAHTIDLPRGPERAEALPPNNLPAPMTSFVGRENARVEIMRSLSTARLVTLTGAGGAGKTRLALRVAADLLPAYPGGVWLIELAALANPAFVMLAIADALGLQEQRLVEELRDRQLLLVLDNCEHLIQACAEAAETLLRACPKVRILATSREPLLITGETMWRVPSLATPDPDRLPSPDHLAQVEAVRLFVDRAKATLSGFELTVGNAQAVAEICHRLDGIPLALELAAARVSLLSVEQINARLDDRFQFLAGGGRTALPRHRTLRATLDWSYELLTPSERQLFGRLSVFAGSFPLEAAEAIGVSDLDVLGRLVDKSLLVVVPESVGEPRYRLLETMREYAAERLRDAGDAAAVHDRYRAWYLALSERAESELRGRRQELWLAHLEADHDNLRTALAGYLEADGGEVDAGLRLASALHRFWEVRGHLGEGRDWLERMLTRATGSPEARARALGGAGVLASRQGDFAGAAALYAQALHLFRQLDDQLGIARSLQGLGVQAQAQGESARATDLYEESLEIYRRLEDQRGVGQALNNLAYLALGLVQAERASALLTECLDIWRELGDRRFEALALYNLADSARLLDNMPRSQALFEESADLFRIVGDRRMLAFALDQLASLAARYGQQSRAMDLFRKALSEFHEIGDRAGIAVCLEGLAGLFAAGAEGRRAVRLLGYAEAVREAINAPIPPSRQETYASLIATARGALEGVSSFEMEWTAGRALSAEDAIAVGLDERLDAITA